MITRSKCCIIGIPDHQGIIHIGGRLGAAKGPNAFRKAFSRLKGRFPVHEAMEDLGDVQEITSNIEENHRNAAQLIQSGHSKTGLSIIVGGGHDHGFSHLLGIHRAIRQKSDRLKLGCINIDAHLDVRKPHPTITSGSPFYLALESGVLHPSRFIEFGIQSHCNSNELWKYLESKKVEIVRMEKLRHNRAVNTFKLKLKKLSTRCDAIVVSLDLDSLACAFSPGVSAPQSEGFVSSEILEMMEIAGKEPKVISLGIFELNPEHDRDELSARLAATASYHFIESSIF